MEMTMKKNLILSGLLILLVSLVAVAGCGDKDAATDETAKEAAADAVVLHDCEGDCGMTQMAAEHTKEIDGHFYCTGCAKKMGDEKKAETTH
jgi:hypothetical protein